MELGDFERPERTDPVYEALTERLTPKIGEVATEASVDVIEPISELQARANAAATAARSARLSEERRAARERDEWRRISGRLHRPYAFRRAR